MSDINTRIRNLLQRTAKDEDIEQLLKDLDSPQKSPEEAPEAEEDDQPGSIEDEAEAAEEEAAEAPEEEAAVPTILSVLSTSDFARENLDFMSRIKNLKANNPKSACAILLMALFNEALEGSAGTDVEDQLSKLAPVLLEKGMLRPSDAKALGADLAPPGSEEAMQEEAVQAPEDGGVSQLDNSGVDTTEEELEVS